MIRMMQRGTVAAVVGVLVAAAGCRTGTQNWSAHSQQVMPTWQQASYQPGYYAEPGMGMGMGPQVAAYTPPVATPAAFPAVEVSAIPPQVPPSDD